MLILKFLIPICSAASSAKNMFGQPEVLLQLLSQSRTSLFEYKAPNYSYSSTSGQWKANKYSESNSVLDSTQDYNSATSIISEFDSLQGTTYMFSKQIYFNTSDGVKNITSEQPTIGLFDGEYANKVMFI